MLADAARPDSVPFGRGMAAQSAAGTAGETLSGYAWRRPSGKPVTTDKDEEQESRDHRCVGGRLGNGGREGNTPPVGKKKIVFGRRLSVIILPPAVKDSENAFDCTAGKSTEGKFGPPATAAIGIHRDGIDKSDQIGVGNTTAFDPSVTFVGGGMFNGTQTPNAPQAERG